METFGRLFRWGRETAGRPALNKGAAGWRGHEQSESAHARFAQDAST